MAEKEIKTTRFMGGQNTSERTSAAGKVPLKNNMSRVRNIGQPDPLSQAIAGRDSYLPSNMHPFKHSKTSKRESYNPAGEFGRPRQ